MEHKVGHRKLQRTTSHRLAMLRNMVTSLIEHEKIGGDQQATRQAQPPALRAGDVHGLFPPDLGNAFGAESDQTQAEADLFIIGGDPLAFERDDHATGLGFIQVFGNVRLAPRDACGQRAGRE